MKLSSPADEINYTLNTAVIAQPGQGVRILCSKEAVSFKNEMANNESIAVSPTSASVSMEYISMGGEGIIRPGESTDTSENVQYSYSYYLTDHLGSTRMVVTGEGQFTEAIAYKPYGTMVPLGLVGAADGEVREKFTGKEFDEEGAVAGQGGMAHYYFGARYLDAEVGVWTSTDPKEQLYNPYGYSTNPVNTIDPDGQYIIGAVAGALIGGYAMGVASSGSWNPGDWSASNWLSAAGGAVSGAMLGSGIENNIINSRFNAGHVPRTGYGARAMNQHYRPIFASYKKDLDYIAMSAEERADQVQIRSPSATEDKMFKNFEQARVEGVNALKKEGYTGISETQAVFRDGEMLGTVTGKGVRHPVYDGPIFSKPNAHAHSHPVGGYNYKGPSTDDWITAARRVRKYNSFYLYLDTPSITGGNWLEYSNVGGVKSLTGLKF